MAWHLTGSLQLATETHRLAERMGESSKFHSEMASNRCGVSAFQIGDCMWDQSVFSNRRDDATKRGPTNT